MTLRGSHNEKGRELLSVVTHYSDLHIVSRIFVTLMLKVCLIKSCSSIL